MDRSFKCIELALTHSNPRLVRIAAWKEPLPEAKTYLIDISFADLVIMLNPKFEQLLEVHEFYIALLLCTHSHVRDHLLPGSAIVINYG